MKNLIQGFYGFILIIAFVVTGRYKRMRHED